MQFSGTVIRGDGYGRQLGFPTANIESADYLAQELTPDYGVYAGFVLRESDQSKHVAGIVIGPAGEDGTPKLEAHLIDFSDDLYGERLTFQPLSFLRPFTAYDSKAALQAAIGQDLASIKAMKL